MGLSRAVFYHVAMSARISPTARRRQLGIQLRRYRVNAGLDQRVAAQTLGCEVGKIIRIEGGLSGVGKADLEVLLNLYKVDDEEIRDWLHAMARESRQRGWWVRYQPPASASVYVGFETVSTEIESYSSFVLPGLVQTPEYARAVLKANFPGANADTVRRLIDLRLERQKRLQDGLRLWVIIDEPVLRRAFPGDVHMRKQLHHLLAVTELPTVTVQVLPVSPAPPIVRGPFALLTLDGGDQLVHSENLIGDTMADDAETVQRVMLVFRDLRAASLPPEASREVIRQVAIGLSGPNGPRGTVEQEQGERSRGVRGGAGNVPDSRFIGGNSNPGP